MFKELHRRFEQHFRAVLDEFFLWAEAPEDADGEEAGVMRRVHVDARVAEVGDVGRRDAEAFGNHQDFFRVGLPRETLLVAHDALERTCGEHGADDVFRGGLVLVRADAEGDVAFLELREHVRDAVVDVGLVLRMLGVDVFVARKGFVDEGGVAPLLLWQAALDELARAVADEVAIRVDRVRREAVAFEHRIRAVGEVFEGVDERAVEVEDGGFVLHKSSFFQKTFPSM